MSEIQKESVNKILEEENEQFIIFVLNDQKFGINVLKSREIITVDNLTFIPETPDFVKGIINLREEIIPIINLNKKFNLKKHKNSEDKVIIISVNDTLIGFAVNEIDEIKKIHSKNISEAPYITRQIKKDYIQGVAKLEGELIILIDIENVFSQSEINKLHDLEEK